MEFGILGTLAVRAHGGLVRPPGPRGVRVFAVLLLSANRVVPLSYLVDAVWDGCPPATAKRQIQNIVATLRHRLDRVGAPAGVLSTEGPGYRIRVADGELDAHVFTEQVATAREHTTADPAKAVDLLRRALALWRGPALADIGGRVIQAGAVRLEEQRLAAIEVCVELEMALGRHRELVGELTQLVTEHPTSECLIGQLMLALYRSGRQAEALGVFQQASARLVDDLGVSPGAALQQLHTAILRDDPVAVGTAPRSSTTISAAAPREPTPREPTPRWLPAPPQLFTGRVGELAKLNAHPDGATVVITAIDGMAGVGKTALAVYAAHRLAERYPDGQLFIDLHGFTEGTPAVHPNEALARMLRALGVTDDRLPEQLDERSALYRSRLADRRVLILLDNAASETQVAPLVPGSPGCLVMVTSRRRLAGLDRTHTLSLDTLPTSDAVMLLGAMIGPDRAGHESPELLTEATDLCDRLPLAIRLAGARLRTHPTWTVADLVDRLREHRGRLDELDTDRRSVAAALDMSYRQLSDAQRRTYRLLGLQPGPHLGVSAAAALVQVTPTQARRLLDGLLDAHLLFEPGPGRYSWHDLVRAHAASAATGEETQRDRRAALTRLLNHYRHAAATAMDAAYPYERHRRPRVAPVDTADPAVHDPEQAKVWLDEQLPNLIAAIRYAAAHGFAEHVQQLATTLHRHLRDRGRYADAEDAHQLALTAAGTAGNGAAQLTTLIRLGDICCVRGRTETAVEHFDNALALARATGQRTAEMEASNGLGWVHFLAGRHDQAGAHFAAGLNIARAVGDRAGELDALHGDGWIHWLQDRHALAADRFRAAVRIAKATGNQPGELGAGIALGHAQWALGHYEQAAAQFRRVLTVARTAGNRSAEVGALLGLGRAALRDGRYEPAEHCFEQALELARTTGNLLGELGALTSLGSVHRRQARYDRSAEHYRSALDLAERGGQPNWVFEAKLGLGRLCHAAGHPARALAYHAAALDLAISLQQLGDQARAHDGLALAQHALGRADQAAEQWRLALAALGRAGEEHSGDGDVNAATIRARLAEIEPPNGRELPQCRDEPPCR